MPAFGVTVEENPLVPNFNAPVRFRLYFGGSRKVLFLKVRQANHEPIRYSFGNECGSTHLFLQNDAADFFTELVPAVGTDSSFTWDVRSTVLTLFRTVPIDHFSGFLADDQHHDQSHHKKYNSNWARDPNPDARNHEHSRNSCLSRFVNSTPSPNRNRYADTNNKNHDCDGYLL
jgi:hypothetical protein